MKRFCKECGKEALPEHNVCIHCGTPLKPLDEKTNTANVTSGERSNRNEQKAKMSKKKKSLLSIAVGIIILLIGFSVWAQNYQSPESVYKRFVKAAIEQDTDGLQNLVVHENGSASTKGETDALIKLVDEEGEYILNDLFSIEPTGKFLYLFEANKVIAIDQYAYYSEPVEGLTFAFNEFEPKLRKKKLYGPLVPGTYDVLATFKGDYGETSKEGEVTLADYYGDETSIDIDINISDVTFRVENSDAINIEKSYILIDKEKIKLNKDGYTEPIGPFILDGSQKAVTVAVLPWGDIESEPVDISESEIYLTADVLSKEDFTAVSELLVNFGEESAEAFAKKKTKELSNVSDQVKKYLKERIENNLYTDDIFYTGEFTQVDIDRNSAKPLDSGDELKLEMNAQYLFKDDYHELEEEPNLSETKVLYNMIMNYDEKKDSWLIEEVEEGYSFSFESTDTLDGAKKVYGPSKKAIKAAKDTTVNEEIAGFMYEYTEASVNAINMVDFSYMEDYVAKDSPRWDEAKDYIDYLDSKNITEGFLGAEVESIEEIDDNTWEVTTLESFTIYKEDSEKDKDYRTKVIVKRKDDTFLVHELVETNEI